MTMEEAYVLSVDICGYSSHIEQPDELARIGFRLRHSYDQAQEDFAIPTLAPPQFLGDELRVAFPCHSTTEHAVEEFVTSNFLPHLRSTRFQVRTALAVGGVQAALFRGRWPYLRGRGAHIVAGMLKEIDPDQIASDFELRNPVLLERDEGSNAAAYVYRWRLDARQPGEAATTRPPGTRVPVLALNAGIDAKEGPEEADLKFEAFLSWLDEVISNLEAEQSGLDGKLEISIAPFGALIEIHAHEPAKLARRLAMMTATYKPAALGAAIVTGECWKFQSGHWRTFEGPAAIESSRYATGVASYGIALNASAADAWPAERAGMVGRKIFGKRKEVFDVLVLEDFLKPRKPLPPRAKTWPPGSSTPKPPAPSASASSASASSAPASSAPAPSTPAPSTPAPSAPAPSSSPSPAEAIGAGATVTQSVAPEPHIGFGARVIGLARTLRRAVFTAAPGLRGVASILLAVAGMLWVGVGVLPERALLTFAVANFLVYGLVHYLENRLLFLAAWEALKSTFFWTAGALVLFASWTLVDLNGVEPQHASPAARTEFTVWIARLRRAFAAAIVTIATLAAYAWWKFKSTRFAESRVGLLKDLLIRVEQEYGPQWPSTEARERALQSALQCLLKAMGLSPWSWLTTPMRRFRQSFATTRVEFLVPDPSNGCLRVQQAALPEGVPSEALSLYQRLREEYQPRLLDEPAFRMALESERGRGKEKWRERFLANRSRHQLVSAAGWIAAKRDVLYAPDSSTCLAFDPSPYEDLQDLAAPWVGVGSFIGAPVETGAELADVLFVSKNVKGGFVPEDQEVIVAVAQVLSRIKRGTVGENV